MAIRLFGPLALQDGDRRLGPRDFRGVKPKQVLEILLAARGHLVPKDRLATLLWGDRLPQNFARALETNVSMLRSRLAPGRRSHELVVTGTEAYRFAAEREDIEIDLDRFDDLLDRAARAPTARARPLLEAALALARGEVLEDEPYAQWAADLRATYRARVLGARLDAADAALGECDYPAALGHAEAALALDRFAERPCRTAMLALYALGRRHEALGLYRRLRSILDEELGLAPTDETRALESAILRQQEVGSLLPRPTAEHQTVERDRRLVLLGRERELDTIAYEIGAALDGRFSLALVEGEAGVGKTRLLTELAARIDDATLGRAGCSQLERHLPYVPLATALRDALGDAGSDGSRSPALGEILPELRGAGEWRANPELEVLEALVALIRSRGPLALILDDLHWADAGTIAALAYLGRRCRGLAVVATVRAEEVAPDHPLARLRPTVVVHLGPLTPRDLAPLGVPGLHERTGGHPRLVAALLGSSGGGDASGELAETLVRGCRAEGPEAHRILVAAAVLEQPFELEQLAGVLDMDPIALAEELERLCRRRQLAIDGTRFRFRWEAAREALLVTVSPARRALLEQRATRSTTGAAASAASSQSAAARGHLTVPDEQVAEPRLRDDRRRAGRKAGRRVRLGFSPLDARVLADAGADRGLPRRLQGLAATPGQGASLP